MCNGRRVTRFQLNTVKSTFPFFELPAELRNAVYAYSTDLSSLERYFEKAYEKLLARRVKREHLLPQKKAPGIFLVNRQTFREASYLLRKGQHLHFSHGLLKARSLSSVISANILRQISSIDITDIGHPMIKGSILPTSWNGYMTLLRELGEILEDGHNLKALLIDFKDHRLQEHMNHCYDSDYSCGFRDQMHNALQSLRKVRGIGKVTLSGLNPRASRELKWLMEKQRTTFLSLPRELRDIIYEDTMDVSDISTALTRALIKHNHTPRASPFPFPPKTTPTVLLLNKQIHHEALESLQKKPINITFSSNHHIHDEKRIPSILAFVSRPALKHTKSLTLTMESWEWIYTLEPRLVKILAASDLLETFHLTFHDPLKSDMTSLPSQRYPDRTLHAHLKKLTTIRGLKRATFAGDLPVVYTDALAKIMTSKPSVKECELPKLKAITGDGQVVEIVGDE